MSGKQRTLFDLNAIGDEPPEAFAQVVFNRPMRTPFTYAVDSQVAKTLSPGKRVLAPFGKGNRNTTGYCVGVADAKPQATVGDLKWLTAVLDDVPLLSIKMLELTKWMAEYYLCSWGQVLDAVLPRAVKDKSGTRWAVYLEAVPIAERPVAELTSKQRRAFETLVQLNKPTPIKEIADAVRCGPDVIKALIQKGVAKATRQRIFFREPKQAGVIWDTPHQLNDEQAEALTRIVANIDSGKPRTFLLYGVTGSGKTEVYLRAIGEVVKAGKQAIVLVPEISLTPQTIQRFRQRFDRVAVLHSHLPDVERNWHWRRIVASEVDVVVGARSAIFAPCPNLGLIVIDEEHENTFKQETTPRYHARDVAIERSKLESAPLILGSATPALETWMSARDRRFELLNLTKRVEELPMPRVTVVDMRTEFKKSHATRTLSRPLERAIEETVGAGGQVILLLNRRGFSTTVFCPLCGHVEKCQHCDIALVYHKTVARMLCHACDAEFPPPHSCKQCKQNTILFSGLGTERLQNQVEERFSKFTVARMDSDTMRSAAHYERTLTAFKEGKIDILLGTQMIAKGLDFPNVHLVGVISADTTRNLPDFRAAERTFQLLAQVAGRTGRGKTPGRVFVQTFSPDDPSIVAASHHDFRTFAAGELLIRSDFNYPPYQTLTRIILRSKEMPILEQAARSVGERLRSLVLPNETIRVLGPAWTPIPRIQDYHRMHIQIHADPTPRRHAYLEAFLRGLELPPEVEFTIDVDPVSLM